MLDAWPCAHLLLLLLLLILYVRDSQFILLVVVSIIIRSSIRNRDNSDVISSCSHSTSSKRNQPNYSLSLSFLFCNTAGLWDCSSLHCESIKKHAILHSCTTSEYVDRFSKFFYRWIQQEICHKNSPSFSPHVTLCCYTTLQNLKCHCYHLSNYSCYKTYIEKHLFFIFICQIYQNFTIWFLLRGNIACNAEHCISHGNSVCPLHAGMLSRRINVGSCGLHCEVAKTL